MRIGQLYQRVADLSGRRPKVQTIARNGFRHAIRLTEAQPFLTALTANDRELFARFATATQDQVKSDLRSQIIPLERPIQIQGRDILALRLKGVYPKIAADGAVEPYVSGKGYVDRIMEPAGLDRISVRLEHSSAEISPYGTMRLGELSKEVETALVLGPGKTDHLLGFGLFDELEFDAQPVGFIIYGMERLEDVRLLRQIVSHIKQTGRLPAAEDLAEASGRVLRQVHNDGLAHRFPHLGNYAGAADRSVRLLDLDTVVKLSSVPLEDRAAFLYLDLSRTINDYQRDYVYEDVYDGEIERHYITAAPLLPFFLWGYFWGDTSLPFVELLEKFVAEKQPLSRLRETFGELPEFGHGWRRGSGFTLVEPTVRLYAMKKPGQIALSDFTVNSFFNQFYQALQIVAASLAN